MNCHDIRISQIPETIKKSQNHSLLITIANKAVSLIHETRNLPALFGLFDSIAVIALFFKIPFPTNTGWITGFALDLAQV